MMSSQFSVDEGIRCLGETYQSLDIRCGAVLTEEGWRNNCVAVRFTYEDAVTVRKRQEAQERTHGGAIETNHFRVAVDALPFSAWANFRAGLAAGRISIGSCEIQLTEPVNWASVSPVYLRRGTCMVLSIDGISWPSLEFGIGRRDESAFGQVSGVNYKVPLTTIKIPDDNYIDFSAAAGGAPVVSSPAD